ncbi:adenosine deaminase 2-like [Microplitis mediator]|uniref:adenosine deaminase 2-like n=1 Tax=Microplitis mediator TaxID=375433 RepID=UPI00255604F7|nr:adenosine deaminase 2-like [Microplitis mediator]
MNYFPFFITLLFKVIVPIITALKCDDQDYWCKRAELFSSEKSDSLGGNLSLNPKEHLANELLVNLKTNEIDEAFEDQTKFYPSKNFMEVRNKIEKSKVFNIIKMMPKGAVLHTHDLALVSEEWIYNNVTYRDNLYICNETEKIMLKFFDTPSDDCNWQLLKDLRNNKTIVDDIDLRVRRELSMITENPDIVYSDNNYAWVKFLKIHTLLKSLLTYRPVFEDHFYQALQELYDDNVLYLEFRSTLPTLYELNRTQYEMMDVLRIYNEVAERFKNDHPDFIGAKVIFSPINIINTTSLSKMHEYINKTIEMKTKFPDFFAGFDLVGHENRREPLKKFVKQLTQVTHQIKFFFHAGETNWYGFNSDENLLDAVLLNTTRIGHGTAILKHPKVLKLAREKNIPIEVCPISNQVLKLVADLRNHPAGILFAENYPVIISNDDVGLWGSKGLSYDFYEAFMGIMSRNADIKPLKQLAINSIIYSAMNTNQKQKAYDIWSQKWIEFIDKVNNLKYL